MSGSGKKKKKLSLKQKILGAASLVLVAALVCGAIYRFRSEEEVEAATVMTATVEKGDVSTTISTSGTLSGVENSVIDLPVGIKIKEILVSEGDSVKKGARLASVYPASVAEVLLTVRESIDETEDDIDDLDDDDIEDSSTDDYLKKITYDQELEDLEDLETLLEKILDSGYITADKAGVIGTINVEEDTEVGSESSTDSSSTNTTTSNTTGSTTSTTSASNTSAGNTSVATASVSNTSVLTTASVTYSTAAATPQRLSSATAATVTASGSEDSSEEATTEAAQENTTAAESATSDTSEETTTSSSDNTTESDTSDTASSTTSSTTSTTTSDTTTGSDTNTTTTTDNSSSSSKGTQAGGSKSGGAGAGGASGGSGSSTTTSSTTTESVGDIDMVSAFRLNSGSRMLVTVSVDEADIESVQKGQTAQITLTSIQDETFTGEITEVGNVASDSSTSVKYPVDIVIEKTDNMLEGMSASAVIYIEEASDVLVIPSAAILEESGKTYVYTEKNDEDELEGKTEIVTGLSNGNQVQVTEGLKEGDTIYYTIISNSSKDSDSKDEKSFDGGMGGGMPGDGGGSPPSGGPGGGPGGSGSN